MLQNSVFVDALDVRAESQRAGLAVPTGTSAPSVLTTLSWSELASGISGHRLCIFSLFDAVWLKSLSIQNSGRRQPLLTPFTSWKNLRLLAQVHLLFKRFILKYF